MSGLISVILTTYNRAALLPRAARSVISQNWNELEVLLVDDGSTDETPRIAGELQRLDSRISYLRMETNQGNAAARNAGLRQSRGNYIAFMDDDDIWIDKDKLRKQIAVFLGDPRCDLVCTGVRLHRNSYMCHIKTDIEISEARLLVGNGLIYSPTVVIRREVLGRVPGFDERQTRGVDSDFFRALAVSEGRFRFLPDVTTSVNLSGPHRMTTDIRLGTVSEVLRNDMRTFKKYRKAFARNPLAVAFRLSRIAKRLVGPLLPRNPQVKPIALVKVETTMNLGDLMMLRSVEERLSEGYTIAVLLGSVPLRLARDRGWLVVIPPVPASVSSQMARFASLLIRTVNRMPRQLLKRTGFGRASDVRAYFDASDFAYGEPWNSAHLFRGASLMESFPNAARFLLPQSLGTLTSETAQAAAGRLLAASRLAFARDRSSASNWAEAAGLRGVDLAVAPDLTVLLPTCHAHDQSRPLSDNIVLLPSHQAEESMETSAYLDFFLLCARKAQAQGCRVIVTTHDTKNDRETAFRVAEAVGGNATAVVDVELDQVELLIADSRAVVSSRFHGILNAFRHEVPVLALGCTDKFNEVMEMFDSRRFVFRSDYLPGDVSAAFTELLDPTANSHHRARIARELARIKKEALVMWKTIEADLGMCNCESWCSED